MKGRPLRFLAAVLGGWIAFRVFALWPSLPDAVPLVAQRSTPPRSPLAELAPTVDAAVPRPRSLTFSARDIPAKAFVVARRFSPSRARRSDPARVALALLAMIRTDPSRLLDTPGQAPTDDAAEQPPPPLSPALSQPRTAPGAARLSGSFWLIARAGSGLGASPLGGQLGGSQTGLRLAYAVDHARRVALVARIASPLAGPGREAAVGVEWRPTRAPVRLVAEQRIAIDSGGGGPAVGVVGGVGPVAVRGFRLEAYGQAGVIGRAGGIGYADGAARIERPIVTRGGVALSAGAGIWGGAQPGAGRLDVGPTLGAVVPIAGQRFRLSADYRARVGGAARPGSGFAFTLGTDF